MLALAALLYPSFELLVLRHPALTDKSPTDDTVSDEFSVDVAQLAAALTRFGYCKQAKLGSQKATMRHTRVYVVHPDWLHRQKAC